MALSLVTAVDATAQSASITGQPANQIATLGGTAAFTVSTTGSGVVFSWFFNGAALPGENGPTLKVSNIKPGNVGFYVAQVFDQSGRMVGQTDPARLTVPSPDLVITSAPQDENVYLGAEAAFFVSATAPTALSYQWFHNSKMIPDATDSVLRLLHTVGSDGGSYTVRISTASAAILSETVNLNMATGSVPNFVAPVNLTVFPGQTARFDVGVPASGTFSYVWRFGTTKIDGVNGPSLLIPSAQPAHAGVYSVAVTSNEGTSWNSSAVLSVIWLNVEAIPNVTLKQGTTSNPIPISLAGDSESLDHAVLTVTSSNPALIGPGDILFGGSGAERFMIIIGRAGVSGTAQLTVTASDRGQSPSATFQLTVPGANTPPALANLPGRATVLLGQSFIQPFTVSDNETDSAGLQCYVRLPAAGIATAQVTGTGADRILVVIPSSAGLGSFSLVVGVQDGAGAVTEQIVDLTIIGPTLAVRRDGPELVIVYPETASGGAIEYRYALDQADTWRPLGFAATLLDGSRVVRMPVPASNLFFRLRY